MVQLWTAMLIARISYLLLLLDRSQTAYSKLDHTLNESTQTLLFWIMANPFIICIIKSDPIISPSSILAE